MSRHKNSDEPLPLATADRMEVLRFLVVGAVNFLLTLISYAALLRLGILPAFALAGAWLIGVMFSYKANCIWVFRPQEKLRYHVRLMRFLSSSGLTLVLNMAVLHILTSGYYLNAFYTQLGLIPLVVAGNFAAGKFWSFR